VIILIASQAFILTQIGMRLGNRLGDRARQGAERLAGTALALLAVGLMLAKLTS
jgi:putative Mn2+ efflux pump MntP